MFVKFLRWLRTHLTQAVVLWVGGVFITLLALFPAWSGYGGVPKGYGPIVYPPREARHIDLVRTGIPVALAAALTALIYWRLTPKK